MPDRRDPKSDFLRFAKRLAEDDLAMSDKEVEEEFREHHGDPAPFIARMRAAVHQAKITANKTKLRAAQTAVAAGRPIGGAGASVVDIAEARRRLQNIMKSSPAEMPVTIAARNETELSDADVLSILQDLDDLSGPETK